MMPNVQAPAWIQQVTIERAAQIRLSALTLRWQSIDAGWDRGDVAREAAATCMVLGRRWDAAIWADRADREEVMHS